MIKTYREYKENNKGVKDDVVKTSSTSYKSLIKIPEPKPTHEHVLAYPENVNNAPYFDGEYKIAIGDKINKLQITNGVIKTPNDEIKEALVKNGFIYMGRKEIK